MPNNGDFSVEEGMKFTQDFEGFRPTTYKDTRGIPTIGFGFNKQVYNLPDYIDKNTATQIMEPIYRQSVQRAVDFTGNKWFDLTPKQQYILSDMAYNLGPGLFNFKNLQQAILAGNNELVKQEMINSNWYKQVGRRSKHHVENWDK